MNSGQKMLGPGGLLTLAGRPIQRYAPKPSRNHEALAAVGAVHSPLGPGLLGLFAVRVFALIGHGDSITQVLGFVNLRLLLTR